MIARLVTWLCLVLAAAAAMTGLAEDAAAHTRSESHSSWTIAGPNVHMIFSVADLEANRLADGARPSDKRLVGYLTPLVGVRDGDIACKPMTPPKPLSAAAGFRRIEFTYACPSDHNLWLFSRAFVDLVPTHVNFAQIQSSDGDFVEQLFTSDQPAIAVTGSAAGNHLKSAGFLDFVEMGIMHIFTGVDHMAFLVGLVLLARRLRDLAFVVTGFTLGHSLTLALAVTGIIRPHAEYIDALVALTIALVGAESIAVSTRRPALIAAWIAGVLAVMTALRLFGIGVLPPLLLLGGGLFTANYLMISGHVRDAGRIRLVVTLVFGLVHGFGFAADLLETRLPAERLAELLVGFNLGVEIGQLTLVLGLSGVIYALGRMRLTLPRPIVVDTVASALIAVGTYWFISRSFV